MTRPDGFTVAAPVQGRQRPPRHPSFFLHRDLNDSAIREPAPPVYGRADIEAARRDGFEAGRLAGLAEAAALQEAAAVSALSTVAQRMDEASGTAGLIADQAAAVLARTVVAAMAAVMPELVRRSALDEAGAMLAQVLPGLSREPRLTLEVPPALTGGVAALLARLAPEQSAAIEVCGLERMAPGDLRLRWSGGEARRRPEAVWQAVMDRLEPALGPAETQAPASAVAGEPARETADGA